MITQSKGLAVTPSLSADAPATHFLPAGITHRCLSVRINRVDHIVGTATILALLVNDKYVDIHTIDRPKKLMVLRSLCSLESELPGDYFMYSSRCCIVNVDAVLSVGTEVVILKGGLELPLNKKYRKALLVRILERKQRTASAGDEAVAPSHE